MRVVGAGREVICWGPVRPLPLTAPRAAGREHRVLHLAKLPDGEVLQHHDPRARERDVRREIVQRRPPTSVLCLFERGDQRMQNEGEKKTELGAEKGCNTE